MLPSPIRVDARHAAMLHALSLAFPGIVLGLILVALAVEWHRARNRRP
jgi:hypothetical protein